MLFLIVLILALNDILSLPLPLNQYSYMLARNKMTSKNQSLTFKEKVVNFYMENLKHDEFHNTLKHFYPSRPIEHELENITSSQVYKFLRKFPKGGNLHIHENQMLDRKKFLALVFKQEPEFDWLYICDKEDPLCQLNLSLCTCKDHFLQYFPKNPEKGWTKVKGSKWTIDAIVQKTTLTGIFRDSQVYPTDSNGRWQLANEKGIFDFYSSLFKYNKTRFEYMRACLDSSLDENVQLIDFRRSLFGKSFYYDDDFNMVEISAENELEMLTQFKQDYIRDNPKFIDFIFIIYNSRRDTKNNVRLGLERSYKLQMEYPRMLRGFDLVGEEDQGHTLLFHSDSLMVGFNYSRWSNGSFNLVFHTAETNWPGDLEPAKYGDSVSTLDNIYDSVLLKTSRVGHGIGLIKQPDLYKYFIERKIAVEICPASNQILGYISDLRNHPAINYFRSGIPIVLAGDDPGSFGYNDLTVDYYLAFMSWGLDLNDLKTIANNSIQYSLVPNDMKEIGFKKFNNLWETFINETYETICLNRNKDARLEVTNLMPSYGPNDVEVEISLFGHAFEVALCQKIYCIFNDVKTEAYLNELDEIRCKTPSNFSDSKSVHVTVQIEDNVYPTNFNYTFISEKIEVIDDFSL